jgi:hypothetical protein
MRFEALLAVVIFSSGCCTITATETYDDAARAQLALDHTDMNDGAGGDGEEMYKGEHALRKLGLMSFSWGALGQSGGTEAWHTQAATRYAQVLSKKLVAAGFDIVDFQGMAASKAFSQGNGEPGVNPGFAPGSRDYSGVLAGLALVQDDEWASNVQRETTCDAFLLGGILYDYGREFGAGSGWDFRLEIMIPYNRHKTSAEAHGIKVVPNAMNHFVRFETTASICGQENMEEAIELGSDLIVRAIRNYYPAETPQ